MPNRDGFVLPVVLFTMAILGLLAVAALATANDEQRSSRALRESGIALYVAEAGAHAIRGTQIDTSGTTLLDSLAATLAQGDSVDLGWKSLPSGAIYRPVLHRIDNGGQKLYRLTVLGRGEGLWGGQRLISLTLTSPPSFVELDGAFQFGGGATIGDGGNVVIDGNDNVPPGWGASCGPPGPAMPGLAVPDITQVSFADSPTLMGNPPFVETPFDTLAFDAKFAELVAQATIVFPPGVSLGAGDQIQPSENPPGVCDTSDPLNWGAPEDPTHPCFDYFPIIYVPDGWDFKTQPTHSGQGIILTDVHAQFENGFSFYGLVMARDGIQVEQGNSGCEPANIYGGLYTRNASSSTKLWGIKPGCPPATPGSSLFYSSCAMQRASAALGAGAGGALQLIGSRAWSEF